MTEDVMAESLAGHLRAGQRDLVPHLRSSRGHALGDIEFKETEFAVRKQGDIVIRILVIPRRDLPGVDGGLLKEMESRRRNLGLRRQWEDRDAEFDERCSNGQE